MIGMLFDTVAYPFWLDKLVFIGFILFTLTSLILSLVEKDRLGFWLGAIALMTPIFLVVFSMFR
jgi:hypothetical protein